LFKEPEECIIIISFVSNPIVFENELQALQAYMDRIAHVYLATPITRGPNTEPIAFET
jgi:hypothetical protein